MLLDGDRLLLRSDHISVAFALQKYGQQVGKQDLQWLFAYLWELVTDLIYGLLKGLESSELISLLQSCFHYEHGGGRLHVSLLHVKDLYPTLEDFLPFHFLSWAG